MDRLKIFLKIGGSTVVEVDKTQLKQKIQEQQQQLEKLLGLWPSAADKNEKINSDKA